ncbi:hypothetical protein N866_14695 [Actinotalea ferrariae CF5-4]|uniref:Deoxyribonuclease NucA/NucB domain-containing protein n=1 Tax=Actinotalea ferrariae CF5-4 TaxID=948458 RepID=A0A021VS50_9CELL|nr:hypothetical protein [Actinotalea ferrariae]EYR61882.1 hypothetical protein N866_14695 [Actinotalea ferrariae CF5-4]
MMASEKTLVGVSHRWYTKKMCSAPTGQQCDEYPFFATVQGGPAAYGRTATVLQTINSDDNLAEGSAYGVMTSACGMVSATAAAGPDPGGRSDFLVVPLPTVAVQSFFVCGRQE